MAESWATVAAADRDADARFDCRLGTVHEITTVPGRLRSILENLFSNARKYRKPDQARADVRLTARYEAPDWVVIEVSDKGRGHP